MSAEATETGDGVSAMRQRRERAKRGPLPSRHAKKSDETAGQDPDTSGQSGGQEGGNAGVSAGGNPGAVVAAGSSDAGAAIEAGTSSAAAGPVATETIVADTAGESGGDTAVVSAGGNPAAAGGGRGQVAVVERPAPEPEPVEPVVRVAAPPRQRTTREQPKVTEAMRAPRMVGRPRGPERVGLTVRILTKHDELLTAEVERQRLSPQYIVDQALEVYFEQLKRQRAREAKSSGLKVQADQDDGTEQG